MAGPIVPIEKVRRLELLCREHTLKDAAAIVRISPNTAGKIKRRGFTLGSHGPSRKPFPADFSLWANQMNNQELKAHYRVGGPTIRDWLAKCPRAPRKHPSPTNKLPIPSREDLLAALEHGVAAAREHFGVDAGTLRTWRRAYGLPLRKHKSQRQAAEAEVRRAPRAFGWAERYVERMSA